MLKPFIFPLFLLLSLALISSCNNQDDPIAAEGNNVESNTVSADTTQLVDQLNTADSVPLCFSQISDYVRQIFQDKKGNLWFDTHGRGVCLFNGDSTQYFSIDEGFGGIAVRGMAEDAAGNIWFGTSGGVTKFDPTIADVISAESFTNFTEADGLIDNDVWSIAVDKNGRIWIGTSQGACNFNGEEFTAFTLPEASAENSRGITKIVHSIMEDSKGQLWFGTNGGAYIYDPTTEQTALTHLSTKDGLCGDEVNSILEDKAGNIWFATQSNGISRYTPSDEKASENSFTNFTQNGAVTGDEIWSISEDKSGNIWFSAVGFGVYRYTPPDGQSAENSFTNFHESEGLTSHAINCIFEDREGRLWFGGWRGLFRYDSAAEQVGKEPFVCVTKLGPWS